MSDFDVNPVRRPPWPAALLVAAAFFAGVAPTLPWLEFAGGSENLVVETALEMRRGGPWFIPTLQGYPRLSKPPLTAWITAAAARPDTVERLSTRDPATRHEAFAKFAWQVRWPTLLSSCLMLVATCALGDLLLGRPTGLISAIACGSSLLFLRFSRSATTDVQLALWVACTNAFLAAAFLRGRWWTGFFGAGAALGLALMSKGPVALVQSVLPFTLFLPWRYASARWPRRVDAPDAPSRAPGTLEYARAPITRSGEPLPVVRWAAVIPGFAVMLAIALPWPLTVWRQYPDILEAWSKEVTREGATQLAPDPWYVYFVFFVWMLPWLSFVIAGVWLGVLSLWRRGDAAPESDRRRDGFVLALLLTVVPLITMSFFKDKNERYTLPMAVPAAVLAAGAAVEWFRSDRRDPAGRVVEGAHWLTLFVMALGVPVAGLMAPRLGLGERWFGSAMALLIGGAGVLVMVVGIARVRRALRRGSAASAASALAATTAAIILLLQYPVMRGYSRMATSDLKPLAEVVWERFPDAELYEYQPGTRTRTYLDLPIYAGRISRTVNDPWSLPQTDRPRVVVFLERRREGAAPLPPPWEELASGGGRKDHWRAYVLPAKR